MSSRKSCTLGRRTIKVFATIRMSSVHPHACGERLPRVSFRKASAGSSPRMWGTPQGTLRVLDRDRFIPTHVGNARRRTSPASLPPVHPHACGERFSSTKLGRSPTGSSPRMWGTHRRVNQRHHVGRFIPTHVGNASRSRPGCRRRPVHPHACGERLDDVHWSTMRGGSSPRMWGTLLFPVDHQLELRFIPTHVGNAPRWRTATSRRPVHPHACGERHISRSPVCICAGSSPRMWGTLEQVAGQVGESRFIPTHVGNASGSSPTRRPRPVHPHACGERFR